MRRIAFIIVLVLIGKSLFAQDCSRYKISHLKDTIVVNVDYVYFKLSIDTAMQQNSGYTDMYFVDQNLDTLNTYDTWSLYIPDPTPNNGFGVSDTVEYLLPFKVGITKFPIPFSGELIIRNPDCNVPFTRWPLANSSVNNETSLSLYPNPVSARLFVKTDIKSTFLVRLYDFSGQKIKDAQMNPTNGLDVSELMSGNYIVNIISDEIQFSYLFTKE